MEVVVVVLATALTGVAVAYALARQHRAAVETLLVTAERRLGAEAAATGRELDAKKQLIEAQLRAMREELGRVTDLVNRLERDRAGAFGAINEQLEHTSRTTADLATTTAALREALSSSRARGRWGERLAEDVLRLAGFVEGVSYHKQTAVAGGRTVPDFTFLLPGERVVHLDVKFPLDNYLRALEADRDEDHDRCVKAFLRDVRNRIREVTTRDYIDPSRGTLDYVLLFIPNEQVYGFVHGHDPDLLDDALRQRVVLCSPFTLFAVLAVIRQAVDSFALEATSNEILDLLGRFGRQWERFTDHLDKLGTKLDQARREYDQLAGPRRRQLERPLVELDELRQQRGLDDRSEQPPSVRPA